VLNKNITSNEYTLSKDSRYSSEVRYLGYNEKGNPAMMKADGKQSISLIWGYGYNYPIAKVLGDSIYKCGFTSFEPDATGNWIYNEAATTSFDFLTGKKCYPLSSGNVTWNPYPVPSLPGTQQSGTPINGGYVVSYWKKSGDVMVNGTPPVSTGASTHGWTYCEHALYNPTAVTVTGSAYIDELRIYQMGTQMEGYTYEMLKGITSGSNASGHISFFEYDQLGRLIQTKDEQGNIVKRNAYQYQGN
jgi:YD repeat-containing protein